MEESLYKPDLKRHEEFAKDIKSVLTDEWKSTPDVIKEICGEKDEKENGWDKADWSREHTKNVLRSMSNVKVMPDWLESKEEPDAGGKKYHWRINK